ncbi:MAG: flagellar basal body rod C-terminal domain-containing protein, partial [Veillonellales bacterium]
IAAADSSGGTDNANNVDQLIKLVKDSSMFNKGTPEDFYNSIVSTLATDSSTAQRSSTNATSLVKTINDRRTSVSGVDTNEETATMTKYQQAYEASSKMVSVWDELYAKTIAMVND